jgi:two-component system invasion response regulator UvrY
MINVILVNKLFLLREGIRRILHAHADIKIVAEATGDTTFPGAVEKTYNVGLVAIIAHPFHNTIAESICGELMRTWPDIKIVVVAQGNSIFQVVSALRIGARGVLTAGPAIRELPDAIRRVSAGHIYVSEEISCLLARNIGSVAVSGRPVRLTERELEILTRLAVGQRVSMIGVDLGISVKTVSTHKTRLMLKLGVKNQFELVHYAIECNLIGSDTMRPGNPAV